MHIVILQIWTATFQPNILLKSVFISHCYHRSHGGKLETHCDSVHINS